MTCISSLIFHMHIGANLLQHGSSFQGHNLLWVSLSSDGVLQGQQVGLCSPADPKCCRDIDASP